MGKVIKRGRYLFAIVLLVCTVFSIAFILHNNQVVATAEGDKIYYNNESYLECFEVFDFEKGKCIGRVEFPAYKSILKMYSIRQMPNCILVDMGMDYRIYKRVSKYNEAEFIGKTSAEIEKEFGSFDCVGMSASIDGLYRNCRCGYTIKESKKGFLGTSPEILFFIIFDENGIAIACEEGYRPGG